MSTIMYTEEHEWIMVEDDIATVGITDYAQEQLGEVVYVELPEAGRVVGKGDEVSVVESVKAASEIYSPASGEILESNEALTDEPGKINDDPEGLGWFYKMKLSNPSELEGLLDEDGYKAHIAELD